jgi:hypothetical protein
MCVIVDANLAGRVFGGSDAGEYRPVLRWLDEPTQDGCLVYGGRLAAELAKVGNAVRYLAQLNRAGRARMVPDGSLGQEEAKVAALGCRSDDSHVLALARVSGARTLCTEGRALRSDFGDPRLIARPRGKVFSRGDQRHLLVHTTSCGRLRRQG